MDPPPNPDLAGAPDGAGVPTSLAGLTVVGRGRTADVVRLPDGRVAKVFTADRPESSVSWEARICEIVAGLPHEGYTVPGFHGRHTMTDADGTARHAIVLDEIHGSQLLDDVGSRPWRLFVDGRLLAEAHAGVTAPRLPEQLTGLPVLVDKWRAALVAGEEVLGARRPRLERQLDELSGGAPLALCHGDFHPGNVFVDTSKDPGPPGVIDWTNASQGPAPADVAVTLVVLSCMTPPGEGLLLRVMLAARSLFLRAYEKRLATVAPATAAAARHWVPLAAATRVTDCLPSEVPALLGLIDAG